MMNWEAIGVIADVVAAIAVVLTLCFLAVQLKQNSNSLKANAAQSVIQSLANAYNTTAMSPELCHVIVVGAKDMSKLNEFEKAQLYMWLTSWFRLVEQAYLHYLKGHIPKSTWSGQFTHIQAAMSGDAIASFWATRKGIYSAEFQEFVDNLDTSDAEDINVMFSGYRSRKAKASQDSTAHV
jgi:hypothetical protein